MEKWRNRLEGAVVLFLVWTVIFKNNQETELSARQVGMAIRLTLISLFYYPGSRNIIEAEVSVHVRKLKNTVTKMV